jgi:hypothetical protein
MAAFDILQEVNSKFVGTVVLYDKKAHLVKSADHFPEKPGEFALHLAPYNARAIKTINLNDPALDYKNYRIGYVNGTGIASWWFRTPHKQWAQGLKSSQMKWKVSHHGGHVHDNFGFNRSFNNMLEGIYPDIESVKKSLIEEEAQSAAFHKDFALSYDDIHDDFILEYHATKIGVSMDRELKQFKILPEARHLVEALQEARSNVHA